MGIRRASIVTFNLALLLLMAALTGIAIFGYVKYKSINVMVGSYYAVAFGVLLGIIGIVILTAIWAICLSDSASYCCCALYTIVALTMALAFIGVGVAAFKVPSIILGDNCTSNSYFQDAQKFSELAQTSICFTCPCYFPMSVIQKIYTTSQIVTLIPLIPLASSVNVGLPVQAQKCTGWDTSTFNDGYNVMSFLESNFQCTGWCDNTSSLFYRFTNVSNGIPKNTCYNAIYDTTFKAAKIIGIPAIVIGTLNFLSVIAFLFLCCQDNIKGKQSLQHNTTGGATTYDMNRMPQLTAQTFNTPNYFQGNSYIPDQYSMTKRSYH